MTDSLNAWILGVLFLLPAMYVGVFRKDIAARMSDTADYSLGEKIITVAASLAPYPFLIATFWTPFTSRTLFLYTGTVAYFIGMAGFYAAIRVFSVTPPDRPLLTGVYRLSRNPMYVSAALVFFGVCLVTASILLFCCLIALLVLQHYMILAEERACMRRYGTEYRQYFDTAPRYLFFR